MNDEQQLAPNEAARSGIAGRALRDDQRRPVPDWRWEASEADEAARGCMAGRAG